MKIIKFRTFGMIVAFSSIFSVGACVVRANDNDLEQNGTQANIEDFDDCVKAGHKILRTLPARCVGPDGKIYIQETKKAYPDKLCKDVCGDGICQEIVCMAEGCPCAESAESCADDC